VAGLSPQRGFWGGGGARLSTRAGLKGLTQGMFCNATRIYGFGFHGAALQMELRPRCKGGRRRRRKARDSRQSAGGVGRENPDLCQDPGRCCRGQGHCALLSTGPPPNLPIPFPHRPRRKAQLLPRARRTFVCSPARQTVCDRGTSSAWGHPNRPSGPVWGWQRGPALPWPPGHPGHHVHHR